VGASLVPPGQHPTYDEQKRLATEWGREVRGGWLAGWLAASFCF